MPLSASDYFRIFGVNRIVQITVNDNDVRDSYKQRTNSIRSTRKREGVGVKSMNTKRFQSSVTNVRAEEVSIRNIDLLARGKLVHRIKVTLPLFIAFLPFTLV